MESIKTYSFVKHDRYDFGIVCFLDSDDTALVCYFVNKNFKFEFADLMWRSTNRLFQLENKKFQKKMILSLNKIKEISFYYDTVDYFNQPFLWKITKYELVMLFEDKIKIDELIKNYKNFCGDMEIYK